MPGNQDLCFGGFPHLVAFGIQHIGNGAGFLIGDQFVTILVEHTNIPVGIGLKWKVMPRLNVGCELSYRFTFSDNLDVTHKGGATLDDPYGIDSGLMKNKDGYSFLSLFVTYDLSPKYRKCNN